MMEVEIKAEISLDVWISALMDATKVAPIGKLTPWYPQRLEELAGMMRKRLAERK